MSYTRQNPSTCCISLVDGTRIWPNVLFLLLSSSCGVRPSERNSGGMSAFNRRQNAPPLYHLYYNGHTEGEVRVYINISLERG